MNQISQSGAVLSVPEAARLLGVTPATAYSWIRSGDLPHIRLGGRIRVPTALLAEMLGLDIDQMAEMVRRLRAA